MPEIEIQGEVTIRWGRSREYPGRYFLTLRSGEQTTRYIGTADAVMALAAPALNRIPWADGEIVLPASFRAESGNTAPLPRGAPAPCRAE